MLLSALGYAGYVSLTAGLVGSLTAWVEFSEYNKKLRGYSNLVKVLSNHLVRWDTLPLSDRALPVNATRLIEVTEAALNSLNDSWYSSQAATLNSGGQHQMTGSGGENTETTSAASHTSHAHRAS